MMPETPTPPGGSVNAETAIQNIHELCMAAGLNVSDAVFVAARRPCKHRHPASVAARAKFVVYLRERYNMSYPQCAEAIGAGSHSAPYYLYRLGKAFGVGGAA